MGDDKLEPQGDGCTKSTLSKMHNGDHLEVRGSSLRLWANPG